MKRNDFPATIGKSKPRFRSAVLSTILVILAFGTAPARGSTLPPSTVGEEITTPFGKVLDGSNTPGCVPAGIGVFMELACTKLGPDPSVSVSNSMSALRPSAGVAFNFEILGRPQVAVPIIISGTASAFSQAGAEYGGGIDLGLFDFPLTTVSLFQFSDVGSPPLGGTFMQDFTIRTLVDSAAVEQLVLGVGCTVITDGASCRSAIDPTIEIDPSFADASQFKLIESTGATGTVPEPSALILFGTCLLSLMTKLRRDRRRELQ